MFAVVSVAFGQEGGTVTLPLAEWRDAGPKPPPTAPSQAWPIGRRLDGEIDRGLFVGQLDAAFEVRGGGVVAVPVLSTASVVALAALDGRPAALRVVGDAWVVDVGPGRHDVHVALLHGERTERFTRAIDLALPPGGPTALDLRVPEAPIVAAVHGGVVTASTAEPGGTRLQGWLDADGHLELSWQRHTDTPLALADARVEAEVGSVLAVGEDVVLGVARVDASVREGEIDHLELVLPAEVEVLDVTGSQVLQWHTDADSRLVVLLRSVVDGDVDATVRFQYPVTPDAPVPLRVPVPPPGVRFRGALGVEAPVGLDVVPGEVGSARLLEPRDVPQSVLGLTREPLRAVLAFDAAPDAAVYVTRQADVEVSSTRIDDLQALTVLVEDGTEVGKLLLRVRNTTRQVLEVELPEGARLTHCFRDGVPLRPAGVPDHPERVRIPLTRSEREDGDVVHVVAPGEVLTGLAVRYYGDASGWSRIADRNDAFGSLQVGRTLVIPALAPELEQAFALELGWERQGAPMGAAGSRDVALPRLDLDVMAANWHLYLPDAVEPLSVVGTSPVGLVDTLHADPFARVWSAAFAGASYVNALDSRRKVFESEARQQADTGADPFPLVGRRIRLRGVLLGTEPATVHVAWVSAAAASGVRVAVGLAAALVGLAAWWARSRVGWVGAAALGVGALVVAHHVPGVHRSLAWGVDGALVLAFLASVVEGRRLPRGTPSAATAVGLVVGLGLALCASTFLPVWVALGLVVALRRLK